MPITPNANQEYHDIENNFYMTILQLVNLIDAHSKRLNWLLKHNENETTKLREESDCIRQYTEEVVWTFNALIKFKNEQFEVDFQVTKPETHESDDDVKVRKAAEDVNKSLKNIAKDSLDRVRDDIEKAMEELDQSQLE